MILREDIKNFTWEEVVSGFKPDERFWNHMELLQQLREWWDAPLKISSGYRSEKHNEAVGGASKSQHKIFATDIIPSMSSPHLNETAKKNLPLAIERIANKADDLGFNGIGVYDLFVHLDLRDSKVYWDNRTK